MIDAHFSRLGAIADLIDLVDRAGEAILQVYRGADLGIQAKADSSPLTEADLAANEIICKGLASLWPEIPILSEEAANPFAGEQEPPLYWAVDPLDGTKEFIKRNGEFTVNVALVENGFPVLGVVSAPALGLLYEGVQGYGARRRSSTGWEPVAIGAPRGPEDAVRVASSRSHPSPALDMWLKRFARIEQRPSGSSLKFCLLAQGDADVYPRFGPTCIWDTAAGHAVLAAAGGCVTSVDGKPLVYKRPANVLNPDFVAWRSAGPFLKAL